MEMNKMKRKLLSITMIAALCLTMLPTAGWAADGTGGTIDDWQVPDAPTTTGSWTDDGSYEIDWYTNNPSATEFELEDAADLAGLAAIVNGTATNNGTTIKDNFSGDTITLKSGSTIDLKDKQWTPIGNASDSYFAGTFDGNNVTISNLTINKQTSEKYVGLFGYVREGTIKNVKVDDAYISTSLEQNGGAGGIVGVLLGQQINDDTTNYSGSIESCSFDGKILVVYAKGFSADSYAGGIVGVSGSSGSNTKYYSKISDCTNSGTLSSGLATQLGGIAGCNGNLNGNNTIDDCTNEGAIYPTSDYTSAIVGGIVAENYGEIKNSKNSGGISGQAQHTGGIAGIVHEKSVIDACKNDAAITIENGSDIGGIVGLVEEADGVAIKNCENTGAISSTNATPTVSGALSNEAFTGGIVGAIKGDANDEVAIERCDNSGALTVSSPVRNTPRIGGIVASHVDRGVSLKLSECYNAGTLKITASADPSQASAENEGMGGLVGVVSCDAKMTVENCYNTGSLNDDTQYNIITGGLIGLVRTLNTSENEKNISLSSSYNVGAISGTKEAGAIVGKDNSNQASLTNCSYLSGNLSGVSDSKTANEMTEDDSWSTNLGLSEEVWSKKQNPTAQQDGKWIGYLPTLKNNAQSPAPTLERVQDKQAQAALTITNTPEGNSVLQGSQPFTLGVTGGSGNGAVTWSITTGQDIAEIDSATGTITLKEDAAGPVVVTVTKAGNDDYLQASTSYQFNVVAEKISSVVIDGLKVPVVGENHATSFSVPKDAHYCALGVGSDDTIGQVEWSPSEVFEKDKSYTAIFRVKPDNKYSFADEVKITLDGVNMGFVESVSSAIVDGDNLKITVTFKTTMHTHNFDESKWASDEMHHWHGCTADGCPLFTEDMPGYEKHTDADGGGICDECDATIGYTITFNAAGGDCATASARTDLDGKISALPDASRDGYTFRGWFTAASGGEQVTLDKVYSADTTLYAQWEKIPEPPYTGKYSYEIFTDDSEHGALDVDRYATEGEKVTITVLPDDGYALDEIVITDKHGEAIDFVDNGDGTITFIMPSGDVTITATFAEADEPECALPFVDVHANDWFFDPVCYVYREGLMTGTSATTFAPNATTTRAMIVSILARQENVTAAEEAGFTDVAENDWFATAVNWAAREGIVAGFEDESFRPNEAITREQLAAILCNYSAWKGKDTSARADLDEYTDAISISSWATDTMSWAVAEQLLAGVTENTLEPQGAATRAQVAAVLQRFLSE